MSLQRKFIVNPRTSLRESGKEIRELTCADEYDALVADSKGIAAKNFLSSLETVLQDNPGTVSVEARTYAAMHTVPVSPDEASAEASIGFSPSVLYTAKDLILKQDEKYSSKPGQRVKLQDFFNITGRGTDETARYIIVSGGPGSGKSILMKHILEKWGNDKDSIDGLDERDLILFADLKNDEYRDFDSLTTELLRQTFESRGITPINLKMLVLDMPILVALDGYDESGQNSGELVKEVMKLDGTDLKVVVTCRPQYVDILFRQIPKRRRKHVCHLSLNNIPASHHAEFIGRLIDTRLVNPKHAFIKEKIKEGLVSRFPDLYDKLGEDMSNPLMLSILTGMWIEHPIVELDAHRRRLCIKEV